jgi:hypothetical protein
VRKTTISTLVATGRRRRRRRRRPQNLVRSGLSIDLLPVNQRISPDDDDVRVDGDSGNTGRPERARETATAPEVIIDLSIVLAV